MVGSTQTVKTSRGYVSISSAPSSTGFSTPSTSQKITTGTSGAGGQTTSPAPQIQTTTSQVITKAAQPSAPKPSEPVKTQASSAQAFTGFKSVVPYQTPASKMPTTRIEQVQDTEVIKRQQFSQRGLATFPDILTKTKPAAATPVILRPAEPLKPKAERPEPITPFARPPSAGFTPPEKVTSETKGRYISTTEAQIKTLEQKREDIRQGKTQGYFGEKKVISVGLSLKRQELEAYKHPIVATALIAPIVLSGGTLGIAEEASFLGLRAAGILSKAPAAEKVVEIGVGVGRKVVSGVIGLSTGVGLGVGTYAVATAPKGQKIEKALELSIPTTLNVAGVYYGAKIAGVESTAIAGYKGIVYGKQPIIGIQAKAGTVSLGTPKIDLAKGISPQGERVTTMADVTILKKNLPAEQAEKLKYGVEAAYQLRYTPSKFISKDLPTKTKTLSEKGVDIVVKFAVDERAKLFGSYPTQSQLPSGVQRVPGDVDLTLKKVSDEKTAIEKTKQLYSKLKASGEDVKISKENPTLIETSKGEHVVDIKYKGQPATLEQGPESKGFFAGIQIERPSTSFLTKAGKVETSSLAEQGLRKGESVFILRTGTEGTITAGLKPSKIGFSPAEHRIEKDIKDYFIVQEALAQSKGNKATIETVSKLKSLYPKALFETKTGAPEERLLVLNEEPSPLSFKQTISIGDIRGSMFQRQKEAKPRIESPTKMEPSKIELKEPSPTRYATPKSPSPIKIGYRPPTIIKTTSFGRGINYQERYTPSSQPPSGLASVPSGTGYYPPSYPPSRLPPSPPSIPSYAPSADFYYNFVMAPPILAPPLATIPPGGYSEQGSGMGKLTPPSRSYAPSLLAQIYDIRSVAPSGSLTGLEAIRPIAQDQPTVEFYRAIKGGKIAAGPVGKITKIYEKAPNRTGKRGRPKGSTRIKEMMYGGL